MFREHQTGAAPSPRAPLEARPAPRWCVGGLVLLGVATAVSVLLWWLRPIASGQGWSLGVQTTGVLLVVWIAWCARPSALGARGTLLAITAVGLHVLGGQRRRGLRQS